MEKRYEVAKEFSNRIYPLNREDMLLLAERLEPLKVAKGEIFINEGDIANHIYYIEKGMVRQFYFKNNRDLTEHISYEGKIVICLESYLRHEPTRLMAEALESSVLWRITYEDICTISAQSREIEIFYRKIFEKSLLSSQRKADNLRFEVAHDRYKRLMEEHPEIIKRAPLIHIASFLQMTPETLSRVRSGNL